MKVKDYLFEYNFEGGTYALTIRANSPDEAKRRLAAAGSWGLYQGEIKMVIPVPAGGPILRLRNWLLRK